MSTPRTNINRLLSLAALLHDLPPSGFDTGDWSQSFPSPKKAECGMTCCIGGWATAIHPGLTLNKVGGLSLRGATGTGDILFAKAFGLPADIAFGLTDADAPHKTPKAAARAVEKVAADLAAEHGYDIVEVLA